MPANFRPVFAETHRTQRRELALRIGMAVIGKQAPRLPMEQERWWEIRIANAAPAALWTMSAPLWKVDWRAIGAM